MTPTTPNDAHIAHAITTIAAHPRVVQATQLLRQHTTELRWHETLRKRWHEAREEAAVLSATTQARIEGVHIQAGDLRQRIMAGPHQAATTTDTALDVAMGLWRANARITTMMTPLSLPQQRRAGTTLGLGTPTPAAPTIRTPAPMLLASIHRDVLAPIILHHAATTQDSTHPTPHPITTDELLTSLATVRTGTLAPQESAPCPAPMGDECAQRTAHLMALICASGCDSLVKASLVHAELLCVRPFIAANGAVARILTRYLIQQDGLDPSGCVLTDIDLFTNPTTYRDALAAYASAEIDGVVEWVCMMASAMTNGARYAMDMCTSIQAGEPLV